MHQHCTKITGIQMELYLCNSIEELNQKAEVTLEKTRLKDPKQLIISAGKLFKFASDHQAKGDAELSYVFYMRYLNLVSTIQKLPDYRKDERYYKNLLGPKNVQRAISSAESLNQELDQRYQLREEEKLLRQKLESRERIGSEHRIISNESKEIPSSKEKSGSMVKVAAPDDATVINSWKLEAMIKQKSMSFLIFDVRSAEDFTSSHIKHPSCFSIPEDILKPGLSAASLYKQLPIATRVEWSKRLSVDTIVLVDWFGQNILGTAIYSLHETLTKWDPSSTYKGTIKMLSGGYDDWLSRFPLLTTNPHASSGPRALDPIPISNVDDIDYPDFDLPYVESRKIEPDNKTNQPTVNRTTKPAKDINDTLESFLPSVPVELETPQPPVIVKNTNTPTVNRNLKQKAIMKYLQDEENMVEKSLALAQEQLDKEKEWERIRFEREVSANSEITAQLLQREEQMIEAFKKLELEKKQQEAEIEHLRKELSQLKARDEKPGEQIVKTDQEQNTIQARIIDKESEKKRMYQEVERLRELRKQRDSLKPKPAIRKDDSQDSVNGENIPKPRLEEIPLKDHSVNSVPVIKDIEKSDRRTAGSSPEKKLVSSPTKTMRQQPSPLNNSMGSKMNRAHSTPDLAQALQAEKDQSSKTPSFERALKPVNSTARMIPRPDLSKNRNFNPVYGSMGRGLTGLKNLGNTCYMNSIIQCISNCALLTSFLVNGTYRAFLDPTNKATRGEITDEVSSALKALWSGQYRSISCKDLKNAVGKYESSFRGNQQQDSHEFLTILIDWLHEELNEVRVKRPLKEQNNKNIPLEKAAQLAWEDYCKSNESIIVKLFGGQQRSTVQCSSCGEESVTFEPFFNLSLPIPQSRNHCNIMDCFNLYTTPEQVTGWSCPYCKQQKVAKKKIDIWKLPPVLVVHLQRFYNDGMWRKRLTMVEFNVNELGLHEIVKSNSARYTRFNLFAVSNHYGTMDAGHYTAYCKNPEYNRWFKFDDQDVMEINGNEVRSAAAYILFYSAIDYEPPQVVQDS